MPPSPPPDQSIPRRPSGLLSTMNSGPATPIARLGSAASAVRRVAPATATDANAHVGGSGPSGRWVSSYVGERHFGPVGYHIEADDIPMAGEGPGLQVTGQNAVEPPGQVPTSGASPFGDWASHFGLRLGLPEPAEELALRAGREQTAPSPRPRRLGRCVGGRAERIRTSGLLTPSK